MNWSQISKEIPSLFVIIFHKVWNSGEGRSEEKGKGSQISIIVAAQVRADPLVI